MKSLKELQEEIYEVNRSKGWWDDENFNIPEKLALIHSEVSEALEDFRVNNFGEPLNKLFYSGPKDQEVHQVTDMKPIGFASELADVIIRVLDLSGKLGIDMQRAIEEKVEYNKTRSFRHGNKKC